MTGTQPGQSISGSSAQSRMTLPESSLLTLLGSRDENLRTAENLLDADIHVRGNELTLTGQPADVAFAERVFGELITLADRGQQLGPDAVRRTVAPRRRPFSTNPNLKSLPQPFMNCHSGYGG